MDEIAALDSIGTLLAQIPEDHSCSASSLVEEGYRLTGALLVGQFVAPNGRSSAMVPCGIGNMNAWTQEGIHAWALRRLAGGDYSRDDE